MPPRRKAAEKTASTGATADGAPDTSIAPPARATRSSARIRDAVSRAASVDPPAVPTPAVKAKPASKAKAAPKAKPASKAKAPSKAKAKDKKRARDEDEGEDEDVVEPKSKKVKADPIDTIDEEDEEEEAEPPKKMVSQVSIRPYMIILNSGSGYDRETRSSARRSSLFYGWSVLDVMLPSFLSLSPSIQILIRCTPTARASGMLCSIRQMLARMQTSMS